MLATVKLRNPVRLDPLGKRLRKSHKTSGGLEALAVAPVLFGRDDAEAGSPWEVHQDRFGWPAFFSGVRSGCMSVTLVLPGRWGRRAAGGTGSGAGRGGAVRLTGRRGPQG